MPFASLIFLAVACISSTLAANWNVQVGANNGFTFTPTVITPAVGDTVTFQFITRNHTATTTNFSGAVCPPPDGGVGPNPFDTGFHVTPDTSVVTIVDTAPHWVSCKQAAGAHCRMGMVLAINPPSGQTIQQFTTNAMNS